MTTNKAIGQASQEAIDAAMALPVYEGPCVFIGAPWLTNDPESRRTHQYHLSPEFPGEGF